MRFVALLSVALLAFKQDEPRKVAQILGIEEVAMPNGLRVLLYPDSAAPKITVNLTVLVGSIHEGAGEAGMAHVFEHILFRSLEGFPDVPETLKKLGADYNGTTSWDRTNFFETMTASDENLETAIRLEAARLGRATPKAEDLEKESKIVESEFDIGASNPQRLVFMGLFGAMYDYHGYGRSPIGTVEDFRSLKPENIRRFYARYYRPDNAILIVAGKFDRAKALALVQKHFGDLKGTGEGRPVYTSREPASVGERRFVIRKPGEAHLILAGYRAPGAAHVDSVTADVLSRMFVTEQSGPLHEAVVAKGLAADVSSDTVTLCMASPLLVFSTVPKGKDPEAAEAAILDVVEKKASSLTASDLERAKNVVDQEYDRIMNSSEQLASALSESEASGSWKLLLARRELTKQVTLDAVKAFAAKYVRRENRVVGRFTPDPDAVAVQPEREPDVKEHDALLAKLPATSKSVKEFAYTAAGVTAALKWIDIGAAKIGLISKEVKGDRVHIHLDMPLAGRAIVSKSISAGEALAELAVERTKTLSKEELKKKLAALKTDVAFGISAEGATISITSKKESIAEAAALVVEMLRSPVLEESALKEYVQRTKDGLQAQRDEPMVLVQLELAKMLYPEGDARRRRTIDGQIEELGKLTVDSLAAFHREFLGADGMVGGVVGDLGDGNVFALLEPLVNGWKAQKPGVFEKNEAIEKLQSMEGSAETPGKPNAISALIQPIRLSQASPDYVALDAAASALFQDQLASRIPKKIRGEKALSYAAGGQLVSAARGDFGLVLLFAMTKPENAARVMEIFKTEMAEALKSGVTAEELAAYKKAYANRTAQSRSNDGGLAATIVLFKVAGRDFGFWSQLDEAAAKLSLDDVNAALRKYVDPAKMGLLQVGDFKKK